MFLHKKLYQRHLTVLLFILYQPHPCFFVCFFQLFQCYQGLEMSDTFSTSPNTFPCCKNVVPFPWHLALRETHRQLHNTSVY